ncbi:hypothetical protein C6503_10470 [Candidatus Poribacteria bacterium]|nr:MAG: hypothetical protein C6503_10470 [Candidatus Poribacteria bacterium]
MKNKFLESFQDSFKQLDFLLILIAYFALTDLIDWTFLQSLGVMIGCIFLSKLVDILLRITRNSPKVGRFFYTPCEHCGKSSVSHTLLGTLGNSFAKPHFFVIFIAYFLIRRLDGSTFTEQIIVFSGIMIFALLGIGLVDILLGATLFKKPEKSEST